MSRVIDCIVARYRDSVAGRTGSASRDLLFVFKDLLKEAQCEYGPDRHEAIAELEKWDSRGILILRRHPRDHSAILKVRLPLKNAAALFAHLGILSPEQNRELLAGIFREAQSSGVPSQFQKGWETFCQDMAQAAKSGASMQPFDRSKPQQTKAIMRALPSILAWEGESLMRFSSALLFKDSKFLEAVRPRIEACLDRITNGSATLADLGIIGNERTFLLHGPLNLHFETGTLHLGLLKAAVRLGAEDMRRAQIETSAARCLTVENAAMLHELAKLSSGTLLASSGSEGGFANSAVIAFLRALPPAMELWHFGDSDPKGFDILRDLRERSGREIRALHMEFRPASEAAVPLEAEDKKTLARLLASDFLTVEEKVHLKKMQHADHKGGFEQESLGKPFSVWPFY